MAVKTPLYGPRVDRAALTDAATAIAGLDLHGCRDLANKLSYLAGVRPSMVAPAVIANAVDLCTSVMAGLAAEADPSRYVVDGTNEFGRCQEAVNDLVQTRLWTRKLVGAAREQLREMVGTLLSA